MSKVKRFSQESTNKHKDTQTDVTKCIIYLLRAALQSIIMKKFHVLQ